MIIIMIMIPIVIIITITNTLVIIVAMFGVRQVPHTCHILPPSEIDSGLCLAVFAGSGGKHLFHRIG